MYKSQILEPLIAIKRNYFVSEQQTKNDGTIIATFLFDGGDEAICKDQDKK